jgi:putative colanic acid biosynthesis glycosyltransferase
MESMELTSIPFCSIVTISLNNLVGLRRTLTSIDAQSIRDFEWIVIDGASSDGTVEELERCRLPNLTFVSERDGGVYDAMNKGLARCTGRYAIFMNSGDCFAGPNVLETVKRRLEEVKHNPDIVFGDALEGAGDVKVALKRARSIQWLHYGMNTHHQAILYSRKALEDLKFDESFKVSGDYDLTCKVHLKHGTALALGIPICIFERGGVSERAAEVGRKENWRVQRDVLGHSVGHRVLTRTGYLVSHFLRKGLSSVYDWLRFQHVDSER